MLISYTETYALVEIEMSLDLARSRRAHTEIPLFCADCMSLYVRARSETDPDGRVAQRGHRLRSHDVFKAYSVREMQCFQNQT